MRALVVLAIAFAAQAGFAQQDVVPKDQLMIPVKDLTGKEIMVDGIKMVKMTGIRAEAIMWDEDGTTYLVKENYLGERTAMRISYVGAAAQTQMWYQLWPVLLDRRGEVYVADDSMKQDYLAKLQFYWTTWSGRLKAAGLVAAGGAPFAILGAADHATFNLFFDPAVGFAKRWIESGAGVLAVKAIWDMAKSHRQLGRGYNFFTRRVATNVERLEYVRDPNTNVLDVKIIYKDGNPKGQPEYMSQAFKAQSITYRKSDCITFLEK